MSRPNSDESFVDHITSVQQALFAYILVLLPNIADAADVLQETNLVLWRKREEFRLGQEFLPWARAIARFQALANLKQQHRHRLRFSDTLLSQLAEEPTVREAADFESEPVALGECIDELTPPNQELLRLRYSTTLTLVEIARQTSRSVGAVRRCAVSDSRRVGRLYPSQVEFRRPGTMMSHIDSPIELAALLSGLIEDRLAPSQFERLGQILETDAAARATYRDHLSMHAMLYWRWHQNPSGEQRGSTGEGIDGTKRDGLPVRHSGSRPSSLPSTFTPLSPPALTFLSAAFHGTLGCLPDGMPLAYLIATAVTGLGLLIGSVIQVAGPDEVVRQSASLSSPPLPSPLRGRPDHRHGRLQVGKEGIRG